MANVQTAAPPRGFDFDPFRLLWRLFTSVRFALALIGFLALAARGGDHLDWSAISELAALDSGSKRPQEQHGSMAA